VKYDYIEGTRPLGSLHPETDQAKAIEEQQKKSKEKIDVAIKDLEEDYNRCYRIVRKTYEYLEKMGLRDFHKFSKYKWSFDKDNRGFSYVCVRSGSSLLKKSLVKRSGSLEEAELLRWIDDKDLVCEALDEAYVYIDEKLDKLKFKMNEMKERIQGYEDRVEKTGENLEAARIVIS
jgi:archaellum component FlaC